MELSGLPRVPATLPLGKDLLLSFAQEAEWAHRAALDNFEKIQ